MDHTPKFDEVHTEVNLLTMSVHFRHSEYETTHAIYLCSLIKSFQDLV